LKPYRRETDVSIAEYQMYRAKLACNKVFIGHRVLGSGLRFYDKSGEPLYPIDDIDLPGASDGTLPISPEGILSAVPADSCDLSSEIKLLIPYGTGQLKQTELASNPSIRLLGPTVSELKFFYNRDIQVKFLNVGYLYENLEDSQGQTIRQKAMIKSTLEGTITTILNKYINPYKDPSLIYAKPDGKQSFRFEARKFVPVEEIEPIRFQEVASVVQRLSVKFHKAFRQAKGVNDFLSKIKTTAKPITKTQVAAKKRKKQTQSSKPAKKARRQGSK